MTSAMPFPESPETMSEAVDQHLEVISEVRALRNDIDGIRRQVAQLQIDVLRGLDASTVANSNSILILKSLDRLRISLGNGHGG